MNKNNSHTTSASLHASDLKSLAVGYAKTMRCNCDLDNWEPERSTGHSHVCRIHKAAMGWRSGDPLPDEQVTGETP